MADEETAEERLRALELEVARLREERAEAVSQGAMLKTLLDDIARRRQVEGKLAEAETWLDLAQQAGRVASYTFDFTTQKLEWSPSTQALYGLSPTDEPTLDRWLAAVHPDDRAAVEAVATAALATHVDVDHRFRIVRQDGGVSWIQDRGRVLFDDEGQPSRLVGINIDVTELVTLEREAREGRERLRLALSAGALACWDWNLGSGAVRWDSQLEEYAGVREFGGSFDSFWGMVHDEDKPAVRKALDRSMATGEDYRVEFRMVRPDGSVRWTHTQAKVVLDESGAPTHFVGIDGDITERRKAEAALHDSRLFLETVLAASPDCIKVVETDGRLSYMNVNGQNILEIDDLDTVIGQQWSSLWPERSRGTIDIAMRRALAGEHYRFEEECPTAAGTMKWWDVSVAPVLGADGKVERIVSISRDISDRVRAKEQLQLLNAELHHRVKNNLATVQALARATLRSSNEPRQFEATFSGRLEALGKTYGLLRSGQAAAQLRDLVESELNPFGGSSERISYGGPDVHLSSDAAVSVGMILHELTTNATKYGALACSDGRLSVRWSLDEAANVVRVEWEERHNGVPVGRAVEPGGFGSVLIDRLVRQLGGTISRQWGSEGLTLGLDLPGLCQR